MFEVDSDDFSGKILSNRLLYFLPPNLAQIFPNVTELSVSGCGLLALNNNSFEGMNALEIFNGSRNKLSEIERETFMSLESLKSLDISFNVILSLEVSAFEGLNNLEALYLDHNKLSVIESDVFDALLNLKVLDLSFNFVKELQVEIFTNINVIEEFYIHNNVLQVINPKIIIDFETAKIIDFRNNTCINQRFPDSLTMVQMGIEVSIGVNLKEN
jgi:Leucine-rich repeat (LRR) protein